MLKQVFINDEPTNYWIDETGRLLNKKTNNYYKGHDYGGYLYYDLRWDGKRKAQAAHRLVAEAFIPNPDNLPYVNHKDGNKRNNHISNLEWVTPAENINHAYDTGLKERSNGAFERLKYEGDLDGEFWVPYKDTVYMVSNKGRVKNNKTNNVMKGKVTKDGYKEYHLRFKDGSSRSLLGHRMIYSTLKDVELERNQLVNHIDGNKLNNCIENLELVNNSQNIMHANYVLKSNSTIRIVYKFDLDGNLLDSYPSCAEAARQNEGCLPNYISKVCLGKQKTHHGYRWSYESQV